MTLPRPPRRVSGRGAAPPASGSGLSTSPSRLAGAPPSAARAWRVDHAIRIACMADAGHARCRLRRPRRRPSTDSARPVMGAGRRRARAASAGRVEAPLHLLLGRDDVEAQRAADRRRLADPLVGVDRAGSRTAAPRPAAAACGRGTGGRAAARRGAARRRRPPRRADGFLRRRRFGGKGRGVQRDERVGERAPPGPAACGRSQASARASRRRARRDRPASGNGAARPGSRGRRRPRARAARTSRGNSPSRSSARRRRAWRCRKAPKAAGSADVAAAAAVGRRKMVGLRA